MEGGFKLPPSAPNKKNKNMPSYYTDYGIGAPTMEEWASNNNWSGGMGVSTTESMGSSFDWGAIVNTAIGAIGNIFGGGSSGNPNQSTGQPIVIQTPPSTNNNMLMIGMGFVLVIILMLFKK